MKPLITLIFIAIFSISFSLLIASFSMKDHNDNLYKHHKAMRIALEHIHDDVEMIKAIAISNSNKLDLLLNIATNVNVIVER